MATGKITKPKVQVYTEKKELQFANGCAFVALNDDYYLVSAIAYNRPSGETDTYAITAIYGRTDSYRLQNKYATLNSGLTVVLTWVAK